MELKEQYMLMPHDLSGSRSKNRFRVELLWGINKILELIDNDKSFTVVFDYVCDIEVHMDKEFEFYQIKTHSKSQPAYTTKKLTKIETEKSQGSILGKLFVLHTSCGRNDKIAIVSNAPYKMKGTIIGNGEHCLKDFPENEKKEITDAITNELNVSDIDLSHAYYICTSLDLENPQNEIIGGLVSLFIKKRGCEVERVGTLYSLIYDQVNEKACYELDVKSYEELLEKKGISRSDMDYLFECHARSSKSGIDQTKDYITSLPDLFVRKEYLMSLAKLVQNMPVDCVLKKLEKDIASFLSELANTGQQSGNMSETINILTTKFHGTFPVEYDDAEKTVFYIIIIFKFIEGVYDENDI